MEPTERIDPGFFLRSFLVLAAHYVALFFGLLMAMALIAWLAFPQVHQLWNLPRESRQPFYDAWEANPQILFPGGLVGGLVLSGCLLGLLAGFSTAWWAPFARSGHGVFLAVVCIVTLLQIALTQPQLPRGMMVGLLIGVPCFLVAGARLAERLAGPGGPQPPAEDGGAA